MLGDLSPGGNLLLSYLWGVGLLDFTLPPGLGTMLAEWRPGSFPVAIRHLLIVSVSRPDLCPFTHLIRFFLIIYEGQPWGM